MSPRPRLFLPVGLSFSGREGSSFVMEKWTPQLWLIPVQLTSEGKEGLVPSNSTQSPGPLILEFMALIGLAWPMDPL